MKVKNTGYDGIEYAIVNDVPQQEPAQVGEKLEKQELENIPQPFETYREADFTKHIPAVPGLELASCHLCQKIAGN